MVSTFTQSQHSTQTTDQYLDNIDSNTDVMKRIAAAFAPHEQSTPDMTLRLDAGAILNGSTLNEVAAQNTALISAPATNPRIDRVVIHSLSGLVSVIPGTEAASPVAPAIPGGSLPVAQINLTPSTTSISNEAITDERVAIPTRPAFRGALVRLTSNQTIATGSSTVKIVFGAETYDTDNIWEGVTHPSRLTVPAGVSFVRIQANVLFNTNGTGIRQLFTAKNGGTFNEVTQTNQSAISVTSTRMYIASPILQVNAGDYFEITPTQTSGGNLDITAAWASMEIVG